MYHIPEDRPAWIAIMVGLCLAEIVLVYYLWKFRPPWK